MAKHIVATVDEIEPGDRKLVAVNGREIGVFNVKGQFYAFRNVCPHQGAPLCLGVVGATVLPSSPGEYRWGRHGEILRCPWHGWEFDLVTGESLFDSHVRAKTYPVEIHHQNVVLIL